MPRTGTGRRASALAAVLGVSLAVPLATGGCVSAGLAAMGPLFTSIHAVADRSVERTYPADLGTAWGSTLDALSRMGVQIQSVDRSGEAWTVVGKGETITLTARLERVTPQLTRASIRAESGGLTADKKTAEEILNQVAISLAPAPAVAPAAAGEASAAALSSLRREVERLGSKVESESRASASPASAPVTLDASRILSVPSSAALPSVPAPEGASFPAHAGTLQPVGSPAPLATQTPPNGSRAAEGELTATSDAAGLLAPAQGLQPVGALSGQGSAR